jgi:hypothetical protein
MKKLLIIVFCIQALNLFSQGGWKINSDPMGDNKYGYCTDEGGSALGKLFYKQGEDRFEGWNFVFEPLLGIPDWGRLDPGSYKEIKVKFKVGSELIDLEQYLKNKYPKYSNQFKLKIRQKKGYLMMVGYDSNYNFTAIKRDTAGGDNLDITGTIIELAKKASKISIDYDNRRYYYSTSGFNQVINQCQ